MIGMWFIPFCISLKFTHTRFLIIWLIFTLITGYVTRRALKTPLKRTTPRLVYKWFLLVHKISYVIGIVGYLGLMLTFLGINFLFFISPTVIILWKPLLKSWINLEYFILKAALDYSIMLMFYGIYYGVLGRDIAEICSDSMAQKIGVIWIN